MQLVFHEQASERHRDRHHVSSPFMICEAFIRDPLLVTQFRTEFGREKKEHYKNRITKCEF